MDIDEILERHNKAFNLQNVILKANAKEAIKEIVKETLRMAAEDAKMRFHDGFWKNNKQIEYFQSGENNLTVDKDSITNVINKIKF